MNLAALTPYVKELVRSVSTAIIIAAGSPKCPDCLVTCAPPARCPDCVCQGGHRIIEQPGTVVGFTHLICLLLGFLLGGLAHWQWCKAHTVVGSRAPLRATLGVSQFPRAASPILAELPSPDLPRINEDLAEVSSTASSTTDSDFQNTARAQVALIRKAKNGGSR